MILLIDNTRNVEGFEEKTARDLMTIWSELVFCAERRTVRQDSDFDSVREYLHANKPEFVCILAHGTSDPDSLDTIQTFEVDDAAPNGIQRLTESYYIYNQLLGSPTHGFFLYLGVCEGYCKDAIAAFSELSGLQGIIASRQKVLVEPFLEFTRKLFCNISKRCNSLNSVEAAVRAVEPIPGACYKFIPLDWSYK